MRLIDADAICNECIEGLLLATCEDCVIKDYKLNKSVDAVPVVRCKECEHWNEDALACDTLPWVRSSEHANWYAEDFCSYGNRKGGELDE